MSKPVKQNPLQSGACHFDPQVQDVVFRLISRKTVCNRGDWGSVLVCLKPKSVVAESNTSIP